jgi:adenylosuccinate synthase
MKKADVVIGANFGDEAKGLITDFLCAEKKSPPLVVRYNGGAQAGHTVTTPDGIRHVFSHFGAGSFTGAATFLSRFFVCNPIWFAREQQALAEKSVKPMVYVDATATVTTPFDMMINQIAEESRGSKRHGSCGLGVGETIARQEHGGFELQVKDLTDTQILRQKLHHIRDTWVQSRLAAHGVENTPPEWQQRLRQDGIVEKYIDDCAHFIKSCTITNADFLSDTQHPIVFEGAQGLLLDQDRGIFPYVTRSNTGLKNVLVLAQDASITDLDVTYITRAYLTRHGAGPLAHELKTAPSTHIQDATNIHNPWQGTLRFAPLDIDLLATTIAADLSDNNGTIRIRHGLAITCLDQIKSDHAYVEDSVHKTANERNYIDILRQKTKAQFIITSHGPSRATASRM